MTMMQRANTSEVVGVPYPPDDDTVERFAHAIWALRPPFVTAEWTGESERVRARFRQHARFVLSHAIGGLPQHVQTGFDRRL